MIYSSIVYVMKMYSFAFILKYFLLISQPSYFHRFQQVMPNATASYIAMFTCLTADFLQWVTTGLHPLHLSQPLEPMFLPAQDPELLTLVAG